MKIDTSCFGKKTKNLEKTKFQRRFWLVAILDYSIFVVPCEKLPKL